MRPTAPVLLCSFMVLAGVPGVSPAAVVTPFPPVATGTGEDLGADGSFDSLLAPGFDLQTFNQFSSSNERRFVVEFDLSSIPSSALLESAVLSADWTTGSVESPTTDIHGYEGDGALGLDDMTRTEGVLASQSGFADLDVDVTSFVQDLVATSAPFAGFLGLSPDANQGIRYDIDSALLTVVFAPEPAASSTGALAVLLLGLLRLVRGSRR